MKYTMAECTGFDSAKNEIRCKDPDTGMEFNVPYDVLIIAVGEITNTFGIEGVKENALFLRELADARRIRTKVIDCFENASLPGLSESQKRRFLRFVVCGGGPTGVEFAAELHDFIDEDVKEKYKDLEDYIEIILVEASGRILGGFDEKLSTYAMSVFERQKINLMTNSMVTKIDKDKIHLKDGSEIEYALLVWATGNTATNLIMDSGLPKDKKKKIITDNYFRVKGYTDIYAIGDCQEMEGNPLPATAQVAQSEGLYLGKYLNRLAKNKEAKPFSYKNMGMLAYVGSNKALADTPQFKGSGFATWIFWRSAYLTKLVSFKNKILVLFDWFKTFLFGRDVSNF
jgi:NADH:ubiquinone reductase (non-electrogenic)